MPREYTRKPLADRLWPKAEYAENGCLIFRGGITKGGYGTIGIDSKYRTTAHRAAWMVTHGPIPEGMEVCHNCPGGDNPACINPDHLWLGTHIENSRDMMSKGRGRRQITTEAIQGEKSRNAKLTEDQIRDMRSRYADGEGPTSLARRFGVNTSTAMRIVSRKAWSHVT